MNGLLLDTSILIKWFHHENESELDEARAIRDAHRDGAVQVYILDLAIYEVGNILARVLGWSPGAVTDQLMDLETIVGLPIAFAPAWHRTAAELCASDRLTFYDAAWAATARELSLSLVSADKALLHAGLAESATEIVARLKLHA
jgi:predicted nucleic acid-binding protein